MKMNKQIQQRRPKTSYINKDKLLFGTIKLNASYLSITKKRYMSSLMIDHCQLIYMEEKNEHRDYIKEICL